jgi:hypothetical protein
MRSVEFVSTSCRPSRALVCFALIKEKTGRFARQFRCSHHQKTGTGERLPRRASKRYRHHALPHRKMARGSLARLRGRGAVQRRLTLRTIIDPDYCLGMKVLRCRNKFTANCATCYRKVRALKEASQFLKANGLEKTISNRGLQKLLSSTELRMPIKETLEFMYAWKEGEQGMQFMKVQQKTMVYLVSSLYVRNNGNVTETSDQFSTYYDKLELLVQNFKHSSLAEFGTFIVYVNKSVPEASCRKLEELGCRVRLVDETVMSTLVCDDKDSGPMMIRWYAFVDLKGEGKAVIVLDADIPWTDPIERLFIAFVFDSKCTCAVLRAALEIYYDGDETTEMTRNWMILGAIFGLRGEALSVVGNSYPSVIQKMADAKKTETFEYGSDQTVLANDIFPLIQRFSALTIRLCDGNCLEAYAKRLPKPWRFAKNAYFEQRCFHRDSILG